MGGSYYTTKDGLELLSVHSLTSRSDTVEMAYVRRSSDNGRNWSEAVAWPMRFAATSGMGRRHVRGGYVDPATGHYIQVWTEGVLPTDEPLEGMRQWKLHYSVSQDGGRTQIANEQIICAGDEYDETHPLPGVVIGKNCVMIGDLGEVPLTRSDGAILVPVQSSPLGEDGEYYNPGAGFTYTDCLLLIGHWQEDGRLSWSCSERVCGDPERTTRGLIEPTIAELADGRLLWVGNICAENPKGNRPRYPLVLVEVDRQSGLLLRDSLQVLDDRQEGEHEMLTLSNFYARADRETGELLVFLPRFFSKTFEGQERWTAPLMLLRVVVE